MTRAGRVRLPAAPDADSRRFLPERCCEVVAGLLEGCSNQEIAQRLGIAEGTVKVYVTRIESALGVHSRSQLILRYARGI